MALPASAEHERLVSLLQDTAARLGLRQITRDRFREETGVAESRIRKAFGSYNKLVEAAGLQPYTVHQTISEDAMLAALRDAVREVGKPIGQSHFARIGRFSIRPYQRRWASWAEVLAALCAWIERNDPAFPQLAALRRYSETEQERQATREAEGNRRYGHLLNFRGLLHAPVNEQGVILLFGAVAAELGFLIESIGTQFPDCDAKRLTEDGTLERVRIEFEHRSRMFREHEHDPTRCDLIVCWEHNWPDCPVEVLELGTRIRQMAAADAHPLAPSRAAPQ
jgi:hypothetical protein